MSSKEISLVNNYSRHLLSHPRRRMWTTYRTDRSLFAGWFQEQAVFCSNLYFYEKPKTKQPALRDMLRHFHSHRP